MYYCYASKSLPGDLRVQNVTFYLFGHHRRNETDVQVFKKVSSIFRCTSAPEN